MNNFAVLEQNGKYNYCPIFDNVAWLLSNVQMSPMDIDPKVLIAVQRARPFNTTFNRQVGTIRMIVMMALIFRTFFFPIVFH